MSVTVVVGGQYGSEGKGKMVSHLACTASRPVSVVRCGGSNAGHTAQGDGKTYRLRQLPSGVVARYCHLYLAAGMLIDLPVLNSEIYETRVEPWRLHIDRNAAIISSQDQAEEARFQLRDRIGSTLTGTGAATARKVLRDPSLQLASDIPELSSYVTDVSDALNRALDEGEVVIVEGTQGFGLSLHHSGSYPYVTSRDTTAAAFLSDVGLSPLLVTDIVMVLRTYPIRVAGSSGPLHGEITWDEIARRARYTGVLEEFTTVTGMLRRVGEFDWTLVERAVKVIRPTILALHGADYLNYDDYGKTCWKDLSHRTVGFVNELEERLRVPVGFVFTGPEEGQIVDRRPSVPLSMTTTARLQAPANV